MRGQMWLIPMALVACGKGGKERLTTNIVVAGQELPAGRQLALLDLSKATVPVECATPAVLRHDQISRLVGQTMVHDLKKGEPVRMQDVTPDLACHHGPMAPVVAAIKDLKRGEVLTEENVAVRVIPQEHATRSVYRTIENPEDEDIANKLDLWKKRVLGKKLLVKQLRAGDILRVTDIEGG